MGTRAATTFVRMGAFGLSPLVTMYRQCDGGPKMHVADLQSWCRHRRVANCVSPGQFNGIEDAAADCIAWFKQKRELAGIYIMSHEVAHQYRYTIMTNGARLFLKVKNWRGGLLYTGDLMDAPERF